MALGQSGQRTRIRSSTETAPPPPAAGLFTPENLTFTGGYRLPETWYEGKSIAFMAGGLTGRNEQDGTLRLWTPHHANHMHLCEFIAPTGRSTDMSPNTGPNWTYDPVANWPVATLQRMILDVYQEMFELDGAMQLYGTHWSPERNRLFASGRSWYNTTFDKPNWLASLDVSVDPPVLEPLITPNVPQQPFGGGFVTIPQDFADAYCGGNIIGLAKGGYESGQGSATSPTCAAWGNSPTKVLQYSAANAPKEQQERRDGNYDGRGVGWQPLAEGDVGYWGVARVTASAWVKTADVSALAVIVMQPTGVMSYELQGAVFSNTHQWRMYIYDPTQLAEVATGAREPWNVRGQWYPLPNMPRGWNKPFGMWWDSERQVLSIMDTNAWWSGGSETYPLIYEFTLNT